jgi:hypothetical protein
MGELALGPAPRDRRSAGDPVGRDDQDDRQGIELPRGQPVEVGLDHLLVPLAEPAGDHHAARPRAPGQQLLAKGLRGVGRCRQHGHLGCPQDVGDRIGEGPAMRRDDLGVVPAQPGGGPGEGDRGWGREDPDGLASELRDQDPRQAEEARVARRQHADAPTLGVPPADGLDDVGERTDQLDLPVFRAREPGQVTGRADQDVGTAERVAGRRPEDLAPDAPDELDWMARLSHGRAPSRQPLGTGWRSQGRRRG